MQYFVCEAKSASELREEVVRYLQKGWRPIGGVAVIQSQSSANWWFYQAIVLDSPGERVPDLD